MKIKFNQNGGIVYTSSLIGPRNLGEDGAGRVSAPDSSNKKDPELDKWLLDILKHKALPVDYAGFISNLKKDLAHAKLTGDYSYNMILRSALNMNNNIFENERWEQARSLLEKENALGEIATTERGELYVLDAKSKKIKTIPQSAYRKNPKNYLVLTNKDLTLARSQSPELMNNSRVISDLNSSVGMKTIIDFVKERVNDFGDTKITGYVTKNGGSIQDGLAHIIKGDIGDTRKLLEKGSNGVYKISQTSTIADTGIENALHYIISTLPNAYKNTLSAKATVEGFSPEALLLQMMYYNTGREITADFDSAATEKSPTGNSTKTTKMSYLESLITGRLPEKSVVLNPSSKLVSDQAQLKTTAWRAGQPIDKNHNGLTELFNIRQMKGKVEATKIANTDSVTFGNQILSSQDTKKVVWDGSSELTILMLPFKIIQGKKTPDFDGFEKLNNINRYIKENQPSSLEINELIKQNFSPGEITIDKEQKQLTYVPEKMMKFLSLTAIACDDVLDIDKSNEPYLEKLSGSQGSSFKDSYNKVVRFGTEYPTKNMKADKSIGKATSWDVFEGNRDFYRGAVYMPIEPGPQLAVLMSGSEQAPVTDYMDVSEKWKLAQEVDASRRNTEREIENGERKELITTFN